MTPQRPQPIKPILLGTEYSKNYDTGSKYIIRSHNRWIELQGKKILGMRYSLHRIFQ